jgi:hypothetical protein
MSDELANDLAKGKNNYPNTAAEAMQLAQTYRSDGRMIGDMVSGGKDTEESAYVTQEYKYKNKNKNKGYKRKSDTESDDPEKVRDYSSVECYLCKQRGHFRNKCPMLAEAEKYLKAKKLKSENETKQATVTKTDKNKNDKSGDVAFMVHDVAFANKKSLLDEYDILCDNQATINIFKNKDMLVNVTRASESISVGGVGGILEVDQIGELPGFGKVYYNPDCIANILCFHDLAKKNMISFDKHRNIFIVKLFGKDCYFVPKDKLYVYNARSNKRKHEVLQSKILLPIQTVDDNVKLFTERQKKNAALAREAQMRMGYPSVKDIIEGINKGRVLNLPITKSDLDTATRIWGKDLGSVVGKSTRKTPESVVVEQSSSMIDKDVILCVDLFYIGGLTFLLSVSRNLNLYMVSYVESKKVSALKTVLLKQISTYKSRDFMIKYILVDNESAVTTAIPYINDMGVTVNQTAKNEHVPEVERAGRTLKERVRAVWNTLPYKLTNEMIIGLTYYACKMINMFPKANSVGAVAPKELFTGVRVDYKRDCKLGFGEYVQVYAENDITNTMHPRTYGAISMGSTGNLQGTYLFMSLLTWKTIRRRTWVEMPLPGEVIDFINRKALSSTSITSDVEIRIGENVIGDDLTYMDETIATDEYVGETEVENFGSIQPPDTEMLDDEMNTNKGINDSEVINGYEIQNGGTDGPIEPLQQMYWDEPTDKSLDEEYVPNTFQQNVIDLDMMVRNDGVKDITHQYNLRSNKNDLREHYTVSVVLTNLSIPKAIKLYGTEALASVMKEMNQLHDKGVWTPVQYESIENKAKIIRSLIFLKRKRDGTLKARLVADGRMQVRDDGQDVSSPTVATESLFLLAAVFAAEHRKVITVDIEGAFLHGIMTNEIYMEISGQCLDVLLYSYNHIYASKVYNDKVYVRLDRALYGTIEAAKVWYDTLSTYLVKLGFKANAHDQCVFNMMYKDEQISILVHVDDLMITCKDQEGIDYIVTCLNKEYSKANVYDSGNIDYLGMMFNFNIPGEVSISMGNMISEFLAEVGADDNARAESPAANYLYNVDENDELLNNSDKEHLHSMVAKALYMAKRGRPDILTAVSFLTTRVNSPNKGDYKKLKRLSSYLNGTKEMKLILKANIPFKLHCYVDASYAVHVDGKGRTGNVVTLGTGAFKIMSTKHNIVTKSSTEAEIVGVSDGMGSNLGFMYLMEEQGYDVKPLILYQDNTSAITLMEKGRSTSQRTKHIATRYFFIKDRINSGEIKLVHMGTKDMIADFYTKPLQGDVFRIMRDKIMGVTSMVNL